MAKRRLTHWLQKSFVWPILLSVAYLSLLVAGLCKRDNGLQTALQLRQRCQKLSNEIISLSFENRRLENEWLNLKDNPRAVEKIAREELHMYGDRELVYYFPDK